jgi:hypothetical protein
MGRWDQANLRWLQVEPSAASNQPNPNIEIAKRWVMAELSQLATINSLHLQIQRRTTIPIRRWTPVQCAEVDQQVAGLANWIWA